MLPHSRCAHRPASLALEKKVWDFHQISESQLKEQAQLENWQAEPNTAHNLGVFSKENFLLKSIGALSFFHSKLTRILKKKSTKRGKPTKTENINSNSFSKYLITWAKFLRVASIWQQLYPKQQEHSYNRVPEWFKLEGPFKIIKSQTPSPGRDVTHQTRLLRTPSKLAFSCNQA